MVKTNMEALSFAATCALSLPPGRADAAYYTCQAYALAAGAQAVLEEAPPRKCLPRTDVAAPTAWTGRMAGTQASHAAALARAFPTDPDVARFCKPTSSYDIADIIVVVVLVSEAWRWFRKKSPPPQPRPGPVTRAEALKYFTQHGKTLL